MRARLRLLPIRTESSLHQMVTSLRLHIPVHDQSSCRLLVTHHSSSHILHHPNPVYSLFRTTTAITCILLDTNPTHLTVDLTNHPTCIINVSVLNNTHSLIHLGFKLTKPQIMVDRRIISLDSTMTTSPAEC